MDDPSENSLKNICCTCLSTDRRLFQLYRVKDGINNLYLLLSQDPEAYKEGFYKDLTSLHVCWECKAKMETIVLFKAQACTAQKLLTSIEEGHIRPKAKTMSRLKMHLKTTFDATIVYQDNEDDNDDNFIDCGLAIDDIKSESDSDTPLVKFKDEKNNKSIESPLKRKSPLIKDKKIKVKKKKKVKAIERDKKIFIIDTMSENEMQDFRSNLRSSKEFKESVHKCEFCIKIFNSDIELNNHNAEFHTDKPNHKKCAICSSFIETESFSVHHSEHYQRYRCNYCQFSTCVLTDIHTHPDKCGNIRKMSKTKCAKRYICPECNQSFENKNQRWKHVQKTHREGYKCSHCEKKFPFKSDVIRHETIHKGVFPREECPTCKKSVRCDLMKSHVRTHMPREKFNCLQCSRSFVSAASYRYHLHYSAAHATTDVYGHKCEVCGKGYRSRGELRDHINFQHLGASQHECPVCGKGLATPRCVTRHVRRVHEGIKDSQAGRICQQCGKVFRDDKTLRSHCNSHLAVRPWACEVCGKTFTQRSTLYEHRKRTHS